MIEFLEIYCGKFGKNRSCQLYHILEFQKHLPCILEHDCLSNLAMLLRLILGTRIGVPCQLVICTGHVAIRKTKILSFLLSPLLIQFLNSTIDCCVDIFFFCFWFRYVALNMLMKAVAVDSQAVQRHRTTILECVKVLLC